MQTKDAELHSVTAKDIESLAEKLDVLAASMTMGERSALARVVLNAATAARSETDHIAKFSGPLANSLAIGANVTHHGQASPVVPISIGELRSKERAFFRGVTRSPA